MALIVADKNRGLTRDLQINDVDENAIIPQANDVLRIIIGHVSKLGADLTFPDAELTFDSDNSTVAGSSITKNSPSNGLNRMRLDAADLNFPAGTYTLMFCLFDNADAGEWKSVSRQTFVLMDT